MPELPEVETTVRDLNKKVLQRAFIDVWTDNPKMVHLRQDSGGQVKKPAKFGQFKNKIKNKRIIRVWRRAKNIIFELSGDNSLLIHQKMTGHLLYGTWNIKHGTLISKSDSFLRDKVNTYIHLIFFLDNKSMIALSDLRKFAKVELWRTSDLINSGELKKLGPEPLEKSFIFKTFKKVLKNRKGRIKQVLMNQEVIAGIGNIYSDEILWRSKIHPLKNVSKLTNPELKSIYQNIKKVLKLAIKLRGESFSDFRDLQGKKGFFDRERRAYQREGEKCYRCGALIKRIKINGRSAHFCPVCQNI